MDKSLTASEVYDIILAPIKKEKERLRMAFTQKQLQVLEDLYKRCQYPKPTIIYALSVDLGVAENQLKQWFVNRRKKRNADSSITMAAPVAKPAKKLHVVSDAVQEGKAEAASIATQEKQSNVASAAVNKENASNNLSGTKGNVREGQVQEKDVIWDPAKARGVLQHAIRQYKDLSPLQLVEAHFGCSEAIRARQKASGLPEVREKEDVLTLHPEVVRMYYVMKDMISEYKGLNPPHLMEAHFDKRNRNNTNGTRILQTRILEMEPVSPTRRHALTCLAKVDNFSHFAKK